LTLAAAIDPISVTQITVEAWHDVIGHLSADEVRAALREHRRTSSEVVKPVDILRIAERDEIDELEAQEQLDKAAWLEGTGISVEKFDEDWKTRGFRAAVEAVEAQRGLEGK